jgi:predicted nucleic acid-binding Zn finger protein
VPAERLIRKARKLAETGRVEQLAIGIYNVVGDHGTYIVAQDHTGKLSCNCPGYLQKYKCSHVTAVMLLTQKRRRKPR